jgi:hypothetical protein
MAFYLPYIVGSSSVLYLSNKIYGVIYDNNNINDIISDKYFEIENIDLKKTTEEKVEKTTEEKVEKTTEEKVEKTTEEKVEKKILKEKKCKLCHNIMPIRCFSKKQLRQNASICKICWKLN